MFDLVGSLADTLQPAAVTAVLVFCRVGAIAAMLPGFGEAFLPARIRLGAAIAMTVIVFPAVPVAPVSPDIAFTRLLGLMAGETAIGLLLGIGVRLVVMALQFAGSIAAQSTSIAQIAGTGVAPDPMPAIGNMILMAGLTLAMILGLDAKAIIVIVETYRVLPAGTVLEGGPIYTWGVDHAMSAFTLAFTLAAPFLLTAVLYNFALGVINRAMPQLMVAFVGAPAITALTIVILLLASGVMLAVWYEALETYLLDPLGIR